MTSLEFEMAKELAKTTRYWRDRALEKNREVGLTDLSFRPESGMSALGWLLAHQGAIYDFSLNYLILGSESPHPKIFQKHLPGTTGNWNDYQLDEIFSYYDSTEQAFLDWMRTVDTKELERIIEGEEIPPYFKGKTIRQIVASMFVHLNHHNGHLDSLRRDWKRQNE